MPATHWRHARRLTIFSSEMRRTLRQRGLRPLSALLNDEEKLVGRSYSLATVAFAVGAEPKWVDNLVARHDVPGVSRGGRGVELAVSGSGLLVVAVVRRLVVDVGMSVAVALPLAVGLLASPEGAAHAGGPFTLRLDRRAIERELAARLVEAAEAIAPRRRGRPPSRRPRAG